MSSYMFAQEPRAVEAHGRAKYRDLPEIDYGKQNVMHDKRVVRGNTYAAQIPTATQTQILQQEAQRMQRLQRQANLRRKQMAQHQAQIANELKPVDGRAHMEVQTDDYLEELDNAVFEEEVGTQTDPVDERPAPEVFPHPYKITGVDQETYIEEGELFDFMEEVEPILQTLTGKALDYGLEEVLEEEELKVLWNYRNQFETNKAEVAAGVEAMEEEALRFNEEKEKRLNEERARLKKEQELTKKIACITKARHFLANLSNHCFLDLQKNGVFFDPANHAVDREFFPWVKEAVNQRLSLLANSRESLGNTVVKAVESIKQQRTDKINRIQAAIDAEAKKVEDAKREKEEAEQAAEEAKIAAAAAAEAEAAKAEEGEEGGGGEAEEGGE